MPKLKRKEEQECRLRASSARPPRSIRTRRSRLRRAASSRTDRAVPRGAAGIDRGTARSTSSATESCFTNRSQMRHF